ncbi:hypothetical protein A6A29_21745 [Streptomyces sp. TSRI0281]|nr:hypothetical protein A6A29_21745 [Streptomyces sp. TSRI0281]
MQSEGLTRPTVAPHSKLVLFLKTYEGGAAFGVEARDGATGAVRWSSAPWKPAERAAEISADDVRLAVAAKAGKDYVVLAAAVAEGRDAVNRGKEIADVAVFPADSSGADVEPTHRLKVPDGGSVSPHDTNGTVAFGTDTGITTVDVTTGKVGARLDSGNPEYQLRVTGYRYGTFRIDEAWPAKTVVPDGAKAESGSGEARRTVCGAATSRRCGRPRTKPSTRWDCP